jgi:hypothetical protein
MDSKSHNPKCWIGQREYRDVDHLSFMLGATLQKFRLTKTTALIGIRF